MTFVHNCSAVFSDLFRDLFFDLFSIETRQDYGL